MPENKPAAIGYRMPAEWESHSATWLAWPHNEITWPKKLPQVESAYVQIIRELHKGEKVNVLLSDAEMESRARNMLIEAGIDAKKIFFYRIPTVDAWLRDAGPVFVVRKKKPRLAAIDWIFNAWGEKYEELQKDDVLPKKINEFLKLPRFEPGIVLEGGSIDVNGSGTLLTTEQCLLNRNRNPQLSREEIEDYLKAYLGVKQIIWLGEGLIGDDTDGHIDDIARFVNQRTVVCALDKEDENCEILRENYRRLKEARDEKGRKLKVVTIPMPGDVGEAIHTAGRLTASYANFYIANRAVLVPAFGKPNDRKAMKILKRLFPERRVVGINCEALVYGGGTIHCITQQQPAI